MSIAAVVGRIDQILQMQQQLHDPAAATAGTAAPAATSTAAASPTATSGPYAGHYVFAAEGVTPTVSAGQTVSAGEPIATIIPGSSTGIEIGFASGVGQSAYASRYGGGYSEGQLTAAGQAFSNLIASLGGPAGLAEGRQVVGHFP